MQIAFRRRIISRDVSLWRIRERLARLRFLKRSRQKSSVFQKRLLQRQRMSKLRCKRIFFLFKGEKMGRWRSIGNVNVRILFWRWSRRSDHWREAFRTIANRYSSMDKEIILSGFLALVQIILFSLASQKQPKTTTETLQQKNQIS